MQSDNPDEEKDCPHIKHVKKAISGLNFNDSDDIHLQGVELKGFQKVIDDDDRDIEFADKHVLIMAKGFKVPLEKLGYNASEVEIIDEWHNLLDYAFKSLNPTKLCYLKSWKRIFDSDLVKTTCPNTLLIVEIAFCLPVSSAICEWCFYLKKNTKMANDASQKTDNGKDLLRIKIDGAPIMNALPAITLLVKTKKS